jgi:SAM-dependent methyltransferase
MTEAGGAPTGVDITTPNMARVYDYMLGGKDNFAADREAAEMVLRAVPQMPALARENRRFLGRAVAYCAAAGIRQFLDIGTGLPTQENVHHLAQQAAPGAHVVYVDNDDVVVSHGRALLAEADRTTVIQGDLRQPAAILDQPDLRALIDLSQPVALLLVAILHFISDADEPAVAVATLRDALAPGSFLVMSHAEFAPEHAAGTQARSPEAKELEAAYRAAGPARSRAELAAFFGDFEVIEPGLTQVWNWRPDGDQVVNPSSVLSMVGGVARKRS